MPAVFLRVVPLLVAAILLVLLAACGAVTRRSVDGPMEERILALVNAARATPRDCGPAGTFPAAPPVVLEVRLGAAAQLHAEDMYEVQAISHTGSDGSSPGDRIAREGYDWLAWGENVASGFTTPESVMAAWLASPGHCANVMRDRYTELGVGRVGVYWAQLFARPR